MKRIIVSIVDAQESLWQRSACLEGLPEIRQRMPAFGERWPGFGRSFRSSAKGCPTRAKVSRSPAGAVRSLAKAGAAPAELGRGPGSVAGTRPGTAGLRRGAANNRQRSAERRPELAEGRERLSGIRRSSGRPREADARCSRERRAASLCSGAGGGDGRELKVALSGSSLKTWKGRRLPSPRPPPSRRPWRGNGTSPEEIPFLERDPILFQQRRQFVAQRHLGMMLSLALDIRAHRGSLGFADRERAVSSLPLKSVGPPGLFVQPLGRLGLDPLIISATDTSDLNRARRCT